MVVVLCVIAFLLAWFEMAWLSLRIGTVPAPVTVLAALLTTPWLVSVVARSGGPGLVPLAVWVLTIGVAGLWSPAGVGVMPQDWRAILLLAAGVLPGMVVAGRRYVPAEPVDAPSGPVDAPWGRS